MSVNCASKSRVISDHHNHVCDANIIELWGRLMRKWRTFIPILRRFTGTCGQRYVLGQLEAKCFVNPKSKVLAGTV